MRRLLRPVPRVAPDKAMQSTNVAALTRGTPGLGSSRSRLRGPPAGAARPSVGLGLRADTLAGRSAVLARERGELRWALAAVAAPLVSTGAWERLGFARLSDYARERLGVSARSVYDLARVHRHLAELPQIRSDLVAGRLTWTKARLLAQVAGPADEAEWLLRARAGTARALAHQVRAVGAELALAKPTLQTTL